MLNVWGPDVRKTLVNDLFQALSAAGLNVFIDSEKLEKGEIIDVSLERAIERSVIRIPIFSKGYAYSVWCLKEAAAMLRTPALIIPLFYGVDPTQVEGWKDALLEICKRSGWSIDPTQQGYEAWLVKTVVNDLIKTLDRVPLEVAEHPVGIDSQKNLLIQKLDLDAMEKVLKLGIWGIGGIGKTTIAKAVYNQIYAGFEAAFFVANVRATATEATGLTKLQKQILKDLINYGEEVDNVDKGKSLFRDRLGGRRVLLILDDVDDRVHLKALVGDWLGPGSRVIITSRNQHILNVARADCIHEMSGLDIYEGLQLFSWHAFLRASPHPSFEDLSKGIVEVCRGHPLSLEVIGSFLYDKQDNRGCWDEALRNITSNPDIYDRLYISYSALSDDEKEIFVDIACFFIGELQEYPIIFWKSLYDKVETAICNLSMKLLIKTNDRSKFDMHDHLRDMGRTIAEREKKGTRLWEGVDSSIIANNITRLQLKGGNMQRLELLYRPGLRYLSLQNVGIGGMTKDTLAMLPPTLIWLRLEHCQYAAGMNRVKIRPRHSGFVGNIWQLKTLQITFSDDFESRHISSLFSLPIIRLQHLDLGGCTDLNKLPHTIGNLSQLQHLDLGECTDLNKLPDTIGNLSQLQDLYLAICINLNKLPNTIGNLSQLQKLNLSECTNLSNLPDTIGNLSQLQKLNLSECTNLSNLPDTIGNLSQLQNLDLQGCTNLSNLPDTIGNLSQLQNLDLQGCTNLSNLPDTIGNLSQLQNLDLWRCTNLSKLPDTIGNLSQLENLYLRECTNLSNLPDTIGNLSQLQNLYLRECTNLSNLPDTIGNLSRLQNLYLRECTNLSNLPDTIGNLSQLHNLYLRECTDLNKLPDTIGKLSQLQDLYLAICINLNKLPDTIGNLSQLQKLNLSECTNLSNLPDTIGNLSQLQNLDLQWCTNLSNLPDTIGNLSQLQNLDLGECTNLSKLLDTIGNHSQLENLYLGECTNLSNLPDTIGNLSRLQKLYLRECSNLSNLPDTIGNLSQLQNLDLQGCTNLSNLPDTIGNLSQLQNLDLQRCTNLSNLPDSIAQLKCMDLIRFY
ncbi:hypothetical protein SUGI_0141350 [Cryptomeria japonica]|nr:hypothetical protein SUGI_0141350 [Cryptomeria japonica]